MCVVLNIATFHRGFKVLDVDDQIERFGGLNSSSRRGWLHTGVLGFHSMKLNLTSYLSYVTLNSSKASAVDCLSALNLI